MTETPLDTTRLVRLDERSRLGRPLRPGPYTVDPLYPTRVASDEGAIIARFIRPIDAAVFVEARNAAIPLLDSLARCRDTIRDLEAKLASPEFCVACDREAGHLAGPAGEHTCRVASHYQAQIEALREGRESREAQLVEMRRALLDMLDGESSGNDLHRWASDIFDSFGIPVRLDPNRLEQEGAE